MRPDRFQNFVRDLAKNDPRAGKAATLAEAGDTKRPFGLAVALEGREVRWQITIRSAEGDNFDRPEKPVEVEPVTMDGPWADGSEGWLARLLVGSGSKEIDTIDQWSLREEPKDGLTVKCHSGAWLFVRAL
ncbi:hypothetical protein [Streptomyces sp. ME19-01-6]|uniref:hypothetical protein n=1 Tax=Streptomyces sp. ME19-01-6 TaxID=3028686 RepID=UPI0029B00FDB|nr:hypothetical protein [Streptomyces sp. ME19-01-6]MDX3232976.1 hypothetical protein [Streptomyces sp. ME19-01-6]